MEQEEESEERANEASMARGRSSMEVHIDEDEQRETSAYVHWGDDVPEPEERVEGVWPRKLYTAAKLYVSGKRLTNSQKERVNLHLRREVPERARMSKRDAD